MVFRLASSESGGIPATSSGPQGTRRCNLLPYPPPGALGSENGLGLGARRRSPSGDGETSDACSLGRPR